MNQGSTTDPATGKIYRLTAPKQRSAAFAALEATLRAAKEAQASFMRENNLALDFGRKLSVDITTHEPPTDTVVSAGMAEKLAATRAAQAAVKAYKLAHQSEFVAQQPREGRIPTINRPARGSFRGRGRGA